MQNVGYQISPTYSQCQCPPMSSPIILALVLRRVVWCLVEFWFFTNICLLTTHTPVQRTKSTNQSPIERYFSIHWKEEYLCYFPDSNGIHTYVGAPAGICINHHWVADAFINTGNQLHPPPQSTNTSVFHAPARKVSSVVWSVRGICTYTLCTYSNVYV
jgi:hypothetical protein